MRVRVGPMRRTRVRAGRRAVPVAALVAALAGPVLLAACTTTVAGTPTLASAADQPSGSDRPSPSGSPTETTSPRPTGTPSSASFHRLHFDLPAGWRITQQAGSACLDPAGVGQGACTLQIVDYNTSSTARQPDPQAPQGWWLGPGAPSCDPAGTVPVTGSKLVTSSFVRMRNKTAAYGAWQVTCADPARNFSPRLWWLPVTKVALVQHSGGAGAVDGEVDKIVTSVTVIS